MRLARYFGTTAEYWINMQGRYNLEVPGMNSTLRSSRSSRALFWESPMPIDEDLPSLEALADKVTKTNDGKQFLKVSVTLQLHVRRTETAEHLSLDEIASIIKRISTAVHIASS